MPFDGTDPRAIAAITMIDALLAYFDGGNKWMSGNFHDAHGRRCLLSAMAHIRHRDKTAGDPDYPELADILRRARAIAAGAPPGPIAQEARKRHAEVTLQRQEALLRRWPERDFAWLKEMLGRQSASD
jgi:hypothetical protein